MGALAPTALYCIDYRGGKVESATLSISDHDPHHRHFPRCPSVQGTAPENKMDSDGGSVPVDSDGGSVPVEGLGG